jgi:signal transduction histidine kinase
MQNVRMSGRTESFREPSRMLRLLKVALAVAWLWMTVVMLASDRIVSPRHAWIVGTLFVLFGIALVLNLRGVPRSRATWATVALLLVQASVASVISTDLYYLMAIELPLVLPTRHAAIAFGALTLLTIGECLWLVRIGRFEAVPGLGPLSVVAQVILTVGYSVGFQMVAFAGGLLAATEARARSTVSRLMAELELTNRLLAASSREAERMDIARELHDTVGHRLAALGVHLDLASRRADPALAESLREAREATQGLLADVREVVGTLRQERPLDLKRSIASLLAGVTSLDVQLTLSPDLDVRDPARAHALLRCVQEGLTNIIRHSHASRVWLDLRREEGGISLRVRDDGQGARELDEGNGLRGMRERLEALGGTLEVRTAPGTGLELVAWVPEENGR